jgi:hypothetical protein
MLSGEAKSVSRRFASENGRAVGTAGPAHEDEWARQR